MRAVSTRCAPFPSGADLRSLTRHSWPACAQRFCKVQSSMGFGTDLWTLKRVGVVIERIHGVRFSQVHIWRILGSLGFSPQKPEKRAIERDEAAVRSWKRITWPALKKSPARRPADRLCGRVAHQRAPRVCAPGHPKHRRRLDSRLGHRRADPHQLPAQIARGQPWDGLKAHRSRLVREYLDSLAGLIQIAFLPPYAPDLNPVEYLWAWLKRHALANYCPNDLSELRVTARNKLKSAQKAPFDHPACWMQATLW